MPPTDRELFEKALEALELLAKHEHPLTKIQVRRPRDGGSIVTVYPHQVATDAAEPLRERLAQPQRTHWDGCEAVHPECRKPEQSVAGYCKKIEELIAERDELRERLEQPEQEPVAWRYQDARGNYRYRGYVQGFDKEYSLLKPVPLYTRPNPQQGNRHG